MTSTTPIHILPVARDPFTPIFSALGNAQGDVGAQLNARTFDAARTITAIGDIEHGVELLAKATPRTPYHHLDQVAAMANDAKAGLTSLVAPGRTPGNELPVLNDAWNSLEDALERLNND